MQLTYDPEADAAYLTLGHSIEAGEAVRQQNVPVGTGELVLDFDRDGRLIGIEILGARGVLPSEPLEQADGPR